MKVQKAVDMNSLGRWEGGHLRFAWYGRIGKRVGSELNSFSFPVFLGGLGLARMA
jgi:hypothetical protein